LARFLELLAAFFLVLIAPKTAMTREMVAEEGFMCAMSGWYHIGAACGRVRSMSKASEWATALGAQPQYRSPRTGRVVCAIIADDQKGPMLWWKWFGTGPDMTASEACHLAHWILDTFEEKP
jgi:hypothetical protein